MANHHETPGVAMIGPILTLAAPVAVTAAGTVAGAGFDPYSLIGSIVTPVIVVVLLLMGKLHTEADYKRLSEELDAERVERLRLQTALTDRVVPALTRSTLVLETLTPMLQTEVRIRAASRIPGPEGE